MKNKKMLLCIKVVLAIIFFGAAYFVNRKIGSRYESFDIEKSISQMIEIILVFMGLFVFAPNGKDTILGQKKKFDKKQIWVLAGAVVLIPATIIFGLKALGEANYYLLCSLVAAESIALCFISFENKRESSRKLVIISVMCALSVAGRILFGAVPQFKPMGAIIIISGVAFGGGTGFMVGALSAFVSNFYFGQGSWTVWQMLGFGIVGFLAGFLADTGILRKNRIMISIFSFFAIVLIYGGIVNISSTLMYMPEITVGAVLGSWAAGISFDVVHALSTVLFIWFVGMPILETTERIKLKYGV